jgi:hypothetical protein
MRIAEKHQIGASGKIGIRHHPAILPDHGKRTADCRRTEIRAPGHDGVNQACETGKAKREAKDNTRKLAGSLLPSFLRHLFHAWKLIKMSGQRQWRNVKNNLMPRADFLRLSSTPGALPAIDSNVITLMHDDGIGNCR